jgi:sec-independent protein translocase protein TatA
LAILGYEGLVIAAILIVLFLWGPKKLPEIARSLGQAKREFEKAAKEVSTMANNTAGTIENASQHPLIVAAKSLGITTEGKTKEELVKEIADQSAEK